MGYWDNAEETREAFEATTADGDGPFLRTGDLGFLRDGELFISGREKELIIFCGSNHYPQDIERTVEQCHPELKPYGGAVFAIDNGLRERIVIVHEIARAKKVDLQQVLATIRRRVGEEHQIPVDAILLIRQGSLPKTSSGKTQRLACRELFRKGQLQVLAEWRAGREATRCSADDASTASDCGGKDRAAPRTETERRLAEIWSTVLGVAQVGIHDDFFDLGGNSLLATQLVNRITLQYGPSVTLSCFFDRPTVAALAEFLEGTVPADAQPTSCGEVAIRCATVRLAVLPRDCGRNVVSGGPAALVTPRAS